MRLPNSNKKTHINRFHVVKTAVPSDLEDLFAGQLRQLEVTGFLQQVVLDGPRGFVYDFAFADVRLVVEIQGGTYKANRTAHTTGSGINRDLQKLNYATERNWRYMAGDSAMVRDWSLAFQIQRFLLNERETK